MDPSLPHYARQLLTLEEVYQLISVGYMPLRSPEKPSMKISLDSDDLTMQLIVLCYKVPLVLITPDIIILYIYITFCTWEQVSEKK